MVRFLVFSNDGIEEAFGIAEDRWPDFFNHEEEVSIASKVEKFYPRAMISKSNDGNVFLDGIEVRAE